MAHRGFRLPPDAPITDRLLYHVAVDVETRCWNWLGHIGPQGYGRLTVAGRSLYAHREAYLAFVGPVPTGLQLDHLCRNRACCNPDHLEAVTAQVNVLRGTSPGARALRRTHCVNGHDYAAHGVVRAGRRVCRTCRIDYLRDYYALVRRQRTARVGLITERTDAA